MVQTWYLRDNKSPVTLHQKIWNTIIHIQILLKTKFENKYKQ